jgi:hypothetical protein
VAGLVEDADMKLVSWFLRIIGLCVAGLALASCSLVKLGYGQVPDLAYWWIDSYVDLTEAQTPRLRRKLDDLAQWHRTQELPKLALLLGKARQLAPGPISPAQACALFEDGRERFNAVTARTESLVLWLAPSLGPAQIEHLARKYAKTNKEWEDDWLRGTPADQLKHRVKQATERFEMLYGDLDEAQISLLRTELAGASYNARMLRSERLRRQEDILQTLRQVSAGNLSPEAIRESLHALLGRLTTPPGPAGKAYAETTLRENCALFARLHNSTSPAQRARAVETLGKYEADFRALAAGR